MAAVVVVRATSVYNGGKPGSLAFDKGDLMQILSQDSTSHRAASIRPPACR